MRASHRLPLGLLGAVGCVLAIEASLIKHEPDFSGGVEWQWRRESARASGADGQADVLFLGDSLIRGGLSPLLAESRLGKSVCTIAPVGCNAAAQYYLLKRVIDRGGRPKAVVVDYMPTLLQRTPNFRARHWVELLSWRDAFDLSKTLAEPESLGFVGLSKLAPSIRDRHDLRAYVTKTLAGAWSNARRELFLYAWHDKKNHGGNVMPPAEPRFSAPLADAWEKGAYSGPWACHPLNESYVRKLLELTAEHSIPVFWLIPQLHPDLRQVLERSGHDERFSRFVAGMIADYPHVVVLDARQSGYEPKTFADDVHLNIHGAACLSVDVSEVLAERLAGRPSGSRPGTRWVLLPRFRPAPEETMLSDIKQDISRLHSTALAQAPAGAGKSVRR